MVQCFRRIKLPLAVLAVIWPCVAGSSDPVIDRQRSMRVLEVEFRDHRCRGEREAALEVLRSMAALDAEHPAVYSGLARLCLTDDDLGRARELLPTFGCEGAGLDFANGFLALFDGDYAVAADAFARALAGYEATDHPGGEAETRVFLGVALTRLRRYEEAVRQFDRSLRRFQDLEDPAGEARAALHLGNLERSREEFAAAQSWYARALALGERNEDLEVVGLARQAQGDTLRRAGRNRESIDAYRHALEARRRLGDAVAQYSTLSRLARVLARAGASDEALACWDEAAEIADGIGSVKRSVTVRSDKADYLLRAGRHRDSIEPSRDAVEASRAAGNRKTEARAIQNLGTALLRAGEYSRAAEALTRGIELAVEMDEGETEVSALHDLAVALAANGDLGQALLYQERALERCRELADEVAVGRREPMAGLEAQRLLALNNLGLLYEEIGSRQAARRYLDQAVALAVAEGDRTTEARARNNLGVLRVREGDIEAGLEEQQRSLELRRQLGEPRDLAFSRLNVAQTLWEARRREEASTLLGQALEGFREAGSHEGEAMVHNVQARFERERDHVSSSLESSDEAIRIAGRYGIRAELWEGHAGRGRTLERAGRPAEALGDYLEALDVIDRLRGRLVTDEFKIRYLADKTELFERAIALQVAEEPSPARATFSLVERARARGLADLLAESLAALRGSLPPETVRRERELADAVSAAATHLALARDDGERESARAGLAEAEEQLHRFELELQRTAPMYSEVVYPEPLDLAELERRVLGNDEALLRYFVGREQALLWVVTREGTTFHRLASPDRIAARTAEFLARAGRAGVRLGGDAVGREALDDLSEMLLPRALPPGARLVVVADGPLHHLPFESLRRAGRHLVEDHEVLVMPSATTLALLRDRPAATATGLMGIGTPITPDEERFPTLSHSAAALEEIVSRFPGEPRVLLRGVDSTKESLLAQPLGRFGYLHFATHGWLDPETPRHYGLQLSPAADHPETPTFLHRDDVFTLPLDAELVVLSACRSGAGEQLRGEGLVGLTRAFLYAGARSVLVSLWNVNDRSTAEFMQAFYDRLIRGQSVSAALRRTKIEFLRSDRPAQRQLYRWAPFVLVGYPRPRSSALNPESRATTVIDGGG